MTYGTCTYVYIPVCWWCVVKGVRLRHDLVVQDAGTLFHRFTNKIFPHDHDCYTGWPDVLLSTTINQAELK